ncbi:MAG: hypothetical protein M1819_004705 [Sarea resinae]|nr:MAG: hypothetical protein M1819_004705 [Sarea resinae]
MALELHVWGPAFSLPSIDAECIAAIAYFAQTVPKDEWVIIADSDPTTSPTKQLPALNHNSTWISGYQNIIIYLAHISHGAWDLDAHLSPSQRADSSAFSAFLRSSGRPLLDLSLYVSTENYARTRTALTALLPSPTQYIIPPSVRAAALARTDHLGLSSLDLDTEQPAPSTTASTTPGSERGPETAAGAGTENIPARLLRRNPQNTLTSLLRRPEHASQFRLNALTTPFFSPLQDLLGTKSFLLHSSEKGGVSSLDCLALGYLSLALYPDLAHPWLSETLKRSFARLTAYVHELRDLCFGSGGRGDGEGEGDAAHTSSLPWTSKGGQQAGDRLGMLSRLLMTQIADALPVPKPYSQRFVTSSSPSSSSGISSSISATGTAASLSSPRSSSEHPATRTTTPTSSTAANLTALLTLAAAATSAVLAFATYTHFSPSSSSPSPTSSSASSSSPSYASPQAEVDQTNANNLSNMGEAGATLASIFDL